MNFVLDQRLQVLQWHLCLQCGELHLDQVRRQWDPPCPAVGVYHGHHAGQLQGDGVRGIQQGEGQKGRRQGHHSRRHDNTDAWRWE